MRGAVFTARSTRIGIATGVLVTAVFGQFVGASWGLAILAGLPAGALALAGSISLRNGKFDLGSGHQRRPGSLRNKKFHLGSGHQRRPGVWLLAWLVMSSPAFLVGIVIETELSPVNEFALKVLMLATGMAAYALGGVMATLDHLDGDDEIDPRLHRVTPPPDENRDAS